MSMWRGPAVHARNRALCRCCVKWYVGISRVYAQTHTHHQTPHPHHHGCPSSWLKICCACRRRVLSTAHWMLDRRQPPQPPRLSPSSGPIVQPLRSPFDESTYPSVLACINARCFTCTQHISSPPTSPYYIYLQDNQAVQSNGAVFPLGSACTVADRRSPELLI